MKNFLQICMLFCSIALTTFVGCKKEETPDRDKFLGSYSVTETCNQTGSATYTMTIAESSSSEDAVLITGFGNFATAAPFVGTVSGSTLSIAAQTFNVTTTAGTIPVTIGASTGTINDNLLTISYVYSIQAGSDVCTTSCTKL